MFWSGFKYWLGAFAACGSVVFVVVIALIIVRKITDWEFNRQVKK